MRAKELLEALHRGAFDAALRGVYGEEPLEGTYRRIESVVRGFCALFDPEERRELQVFSAPGRTELGGNHTDHQRGHALAASVNMDTLGCAALREDRVIRVQSKGHSAAQIELSDLTVHEEERSRSIALLRGVAARISQLGYTPGGFDAYTETRVLRGAGLSSSAAFEILIGTIVNQLFCRGELDATQLAKIGQYAENVFYGKPCGLLDQLACAAGGVIAVDFADPQEPKIRRCTMDAAKAGYALVIIDSGANHSDLDAEYALIPGEMGAVARFFGKEALNEVDEAEFERRRGEAEAACGRRPVLRAEHFYAETRRAEAQYDALSAGDFPRFLELVRASGRSSEEKLQNVSLDRPDGDRLLRVVHRAEELAGETGAARVHGGGFAGTAQAYVPLERLDAFIAGMEADFGAGCCHLVRVRNTGGVRLIP